MIDFHSICTITCGYYCHTVSWTLSMQQEFQGVPEYQWCTTVPHHIIPTTAVKPNQGLVNNVFPNMNRLRYSDTYLGRYYHCQPGKINSTGLRLSLQGVPHFIRFQLCNLHQLLVKRCRSAASSMLVRLFRC